MATAPQAPAAADSTVPPATEALEKNHDLIASDRVEGTRVYRPTGEKIGHIERIMIEKVSGKAAYAIMNFGGFLGMGEYSYPLPWSVLKYNPRLGGYEVNVTDEQLKSAPHLRSDESWDDGNRDRDTMIYGYYGVPPYWL
jgi:PRC-barrel domain